MNTRSLQIVTAMALMAGAARAAFAASGTKFSQSLETSVQYNPHSRWSIPLSVARLSLPKPLSAKRRES